MTCGIQRGEEREGSKMIKAVILSLLCLHVHALMSTVSAENGYTTAGLPREKPQGPQWGYTNLTAWPKLCQTGKRQSPVSFSELQPNEVVHRKDMGPLVFSRGCNFAAEKTSLKIENEVNTISVRFIPLDDPTNKIPSLCTVRDPTDRDSPEYHFVSMHFHSPAEHVLPCANPDAELHLVFAHTQQSRQPHLMVVVVQLVASDKINSTSVAALKHILLDGSLPPKRAVTTCTLTENMTIAGFLPQSGSYFAYNGSLTTPPCTEGVLFVVLTSPQIISKTALERLVEAFQRSRPGNHNGNHRPTQPLNGRVVYHFVDMQHMNYSMCMRNMENHHKNSSQMEGMSGAMHHMNCSMCMRNMENHHKNSSQMEGMSGAMHHMNCSMCMRNMENHHKNSSQMEGMSGAMHHMNCSMCMRNMENHHKNSSQMEGMSSEEMSMMERSANVPSGAQLAGLASEENATNTSSAPANKWPHQFNSRERLFLIAAALVLLLVTFILYRWRNSTAGENETESLFRSHEGYGTTNP
ncbi:putative carbonic anhydrase-like protein [Trypanosoma cruzi]|uniref:carbonic anhydrase n=2 Tax=Trypanosoma cruzi TaxID=5693 RepID=Q4DKE0_TRYCC|nr:carbonic anhydrase-like protein, putative [Trypanosoma cruzi]EAN92997.1 carbonic anhydrase-like protein, putative [Trypanosoma cruzi]PWU91939.1 putative carbonic anhydrase-like protein [Trypanosoma cruzi]|eukprot:XP_814848.1 carbonic anhydrase-like protein [Trypanosoma cruzi strain CL Brener]